jgi:hypothetical protein
VASACGFGLPPGSVTTLSDGERAARRCARRPRAPAAESYATERNKQSQPALEDRATKRTDHAAASHAMAISVGFDPVGWRCVDRSEL